MSANPGFEIPTDMRKISEQSMDQVRNAINSYFQFLQRAVPENVMGGSELSNKVLSFAERNVANAFDFGQRLMQVRDVHALMQLQMDFIRMQTQAITEQAHELQETTTKTMYDAMKSRYLIS
jgi:hypothetical protein